MEFVVLVDEQDNATGTIEKMEAHRKGMLHRAFSILLYNEKGEILLQRRSLKKYHSGGLWTNTCCSHPQPDETMAAATRRKLKQEMGIDLQPSFAYKFIYKIDLENNLTEHEYDHVFVGRFDGEPIINPEEVDEWRFASVDQIRKEMKLKPTEFTHWFKIIVNDTALSDFVN